MAQQMVVDDCKGPGNAAPLLSTKRITTRSKGAGRPRLDSEMSDAVLASVPRLRAFARSLSGSVDRADDLVQETVLRALAHIDTFEPGTNLGAWLFTILRNVFRSEYRRRRREVEDVESRYAVTLKSHPAQTGSVEFNELRKALLKLSAEQREAVILVGAAGLSYDEAAAVCDCAVGTIKSRVNRARARLAELLAVDGIDDFGPDNTTRAVLVSNGRG
jgi:RNA polymerase sigma-70 factor, ECF subfamily